MGPSYPKCSRYRWEELIVENRDRGVLLVPEKNSIVEMNKGPNNFNPALTPHLWSDCSQGIMASVSNSPTLENHQSQ